jgi:hypothetical protein
VRRKKLIILLASVVTALAVLAVIALASRAPATSTALEPSPAPSPSPTTAPPAWLLAFMSREARNCGDSHASAWWTLTTAEKAHVVEGGDDPGSVTDPGRPVYVYILHGDFTRWIWSLPAGTAAPTYSWVVEQIDAKSRIGDMGGNSDKPFDTTGLAMHSVVLTGREPSPAPAPAAGNVSGSVSLREPDGERPGSGLTVTARSEHPSRHAVTAQTGPDGSFRLALKPGWYLLTVDYWGEPALQIRVPEAGVAFAPVSAPSRELAQTKRMTVNDPPSVIPPHGVRLGSLGVLLEPVWPEVSKTISRARAVTAALGGARPARAFVATVTDRGRMLGPKQPMVDWLAWVVVRDLPRPTDCVIGGMKTAGTTRTPGLVTHSVSLIDARTGRLLLGFFTK